MNRFALSLSSISHSSLFPKLFRFICKIFLEVRFYFAVIIFLLQLMQHVVLHCRLVANFGCFSAIINLIAIFCRNDGFTLRKKLIIPFQSHQIDKTLSEIATVEVLLS